MNGTIHLFKIEEFANNGKKNFSDFIRFLQNTNDP